MGGKHKKKTLLTIFRKMGMMLYQPHVLSRWKSRAWYFSLHALARFRMAHRVSVSGQYKCRSLISFRVVVALERSIPTYL